MTCQQVQVNLSLYLYGELEFAKEEELELHLPGCSFCQLAFAREKAWHISLNTERQDVPLDLLSRCRRDLRVALQPKSSLPVQPSSSLDRVFSVLCKVLPIGGNVSVLNRWRFNSLRLSSVRWSPKLAFASLFLFLGFSLSRFTDRFPILTNLQFGDPTQAGFAPAFSRVRAVQGSDQNRVRIIVDRIRQQEVVGSINDASIRELLLQGSKDPGDPGLRVDAVELLQGHDGSDIRDALLFSVTHDENAAVRLKALEGLRRFKDDRETRDALLEVLEGDASPAVRTEAIDVLVPANSVAPVSSDLVDTLRGIIRSEPADDYLHARCLQILGSGKPSGLY